MISIGAIVDAIRASPSEFAKVFLQAQAGRPGEPLAFEAVGRNDDPRKNLLSALLHAQAHGFIDSLIRGLAAEKLENGTLIEELFHSDVEANAALQSVTNAARGFQHPHIIYRGYADGIRWTAKILVDGIAAGTGVLIGPSLVLTAWHVVRQLFEQAGGAWAPVQNAYDRLRVDFDDVLTSLHYNRPLEQRGHRAVKPINQQNCLVSFSSCHAEELLFHRLPADYAQLDGYWDYCVIRLAEPVGQERRWARLDRRFTIPGVGEPVFIFQHPSQQPLRVDQAKIVTGPGLPGRSADCRFFHDVNTANGSSGGPCFDQNFRLVGLHQGEWKGGAVNRGIPVKGILEHYHPNTTPEPSELRAWNLGVSQTFRPIIGCDKFQELLWKLTLDSDLRLVIINGRQASGKTFRTEVLRAILPESEHLKVPLHAQSMAKVEAALLAEKICAAAGSPKPDFPPFSKENSTPAVWLKDVVVPAILRSLEQVRQDRLVWLVFTDLNRFEVEGEQASECLYGLYEQVLTHKWLRIVLDGMDGDMPAALNGYYETHYVDDITVDHIRTCLKRAYVSLDLDLSAIGPIALNASGSRLLQDYQKALSEYERTTPPRGSPPMAVLATKLRQEITNVLDAAKGA